MLLHFQGDKVFFTSGLTTLSRENIMCSLAPISNLGIYLDSWKVYSKFSIRNVVAIRRKEDFQEFKEVVQGYPVTGIPLFLIFLNKIEDMSEIHKSLMSNCLNLTFDSHLLIKFYNDSIIKEMYSICRNEVHVTNHAHWNEINGLARISNQTLFIRRNSLQGCPLKIDYFNVITWLNLFFRVQKLIVEFFFQKTDVDVSRREYFLKIIKILAQTTNFSIVNRTKNLKFYDIWNLANQSINEGVDIIAEDIFLTNDRSDAARFLFPVKWSHVHYYVKRNKISMRTFNLYRVIYDWL